MNNAELYAPILKACRKHGLGILMENIEEETDIEIDGLRNAPLFSIYWKEDEEEVHFSSTYEFAEEAPDYRIVNHRIRETPFSEVQSNDADFLLAFVGHLRKDEMTDDSVGSLLDKLSQEGGFLQELQSMSLRKGDPLPLEGSSYEKVRGYFQTYGDGRLRIIRRALNMSMREVQGCIDRLLKEGLIIPDEDYEFVWNHQ